MNNELIYSRDYYQFLSPSCEFDSIRQPVGRTIPLQLSSASPTFRPQPQRCTKPACACAVPTLQHKLEKGGEKKRGNKSPNAKQKVLASTAPITIHNSSLTTFVLFTKNHKVTFYLVSLWARANDQAHTIHSSDTRSSKGKSMA